MADEKKLDIIIAVKDLASQAFKNIQTGLKTMADDTKSFNKSMKDVDAGLTKMRNTALIATTAVTGLIAASVGKFSSVGDEIEKMATRTGLATESISALRVAADASGTSIQSIETGIKLMQKGLAGVNEEGTKTGPILEALGINTEKLAKLQPERQFEMIGNAIGKIPDPAARTAAAMALMGRSGADLLPLFKDGSFKMEEWSKKAKELGVSFDKDLAAKAAKLNDELGFTKQQLTGMAIAAGTALAPAVEKLVAQFSHAVAGVTLWISKNPDLIVHLATLALKTGAFIITVTTLGGTLLKLIPIIKLVASSFVFLATNPIGLTIAAVAILTADIMTLISAWNMWQAAQGQQQATDVGVINGATGAWKNFNDQQEKAGRNFRMTAEAFSRLDMGAQLDFIRKYGKGAAAAGQAIADAADPLAALKKQAADAEAALNGLGGAAGDAGDPLKGLGLDMAALLKALSGNTDDGKSAKKAAQDMADALSGLAKSAVNAQQGIGDALKASAANIADIRKQLNDLDTSKAGEVGGAKQALAKAFVDAQARADALRKSIADAEAAGGMDLSSSRDERSGLLDAVNRENDAVKKAKLQADLDTWDAKDALRRGKSYQEIAEQKRQLEAIQAETVKFGNVEQSVGAEVQAARDDSRKTDLERAVDAYNAQRVQIDAKYDAERKALQAKLDDEQKVQDSLTAIRDRAQKSAEGFVLRTEKVTVDSIKRQIDAYDALAEAVGRATSGKLSAADVKAGKTSGDIINHFNIAGGNADDIVRQIIAIIDRRSGLTAAGN